MRSVAVAGPVDRRGESCKFSRPNFSDSREEIGYKFVVGDGGGRQQEVKGRGSFTVLTESKEGERLIQFSVFSLIQLAGRLRPRILAVS